MKNCLISSTSTLAFALALSPAFAEPSGDRPDEAHAYAVHDVNRPDPVKVEAPENGIPSDAIVLFDGTQDSLDRHWCDSKGEPVKWKIEDGAFVCAPGSGSASTRDKFSDCQLHIEWKTPLNDVEGWGNSGVFFGSYEIQILDSSAIVPSRSPWKPANYADGQAGAVYGQHPALVNPCRKPGVWQSYDIVFHAPRRENGQLIDTGSLTVFFNGVLVQDNWKLQGKTGWCRRAKDHPEESEFPIRLQDHGHPVPFRNIWVRRIPSPYTDTINGGVYGKKADVAALRHKLAGESLAFAREATTSMEKFIRLWEAYCYEPDRKLKPELDAVEKACLADLEKRTGGFEDMHRFYAFQRFVKMLVSTEWIPSDAPIAKAMNDAKPPAPKPTAPNLRDV